MGIWVGQLGQLGEAKYPIHVEDFSLGPCHTLVLEKTLIYLSVLSFYCSLYVCVMGQSEYYGIHMEWLVLCLSIVGKIF